MSEEDSTVGYELVQRMEALYSGGSVGAVDDLLFFAYGDAIRVVRSNFLDVVRTVAVDGELLAFCTHPTRAEVVVSVTGGDLLHYSGLGDGSEAVRLLRRWSSGSKAAIVSLAFDASGQLLATGCSTGPVRVWDLQGYYVTHSFKGHVQRVSVLRFHPLAGRLLLASGGEDGTLRLWELRRERVHRHRAARMHASAVRDVAFLGRAGAALTAGGDRTIALLGAAAARALEGEGEQQESKSKKKKKKKQQPPPQQQTEGALETPTRIFPVLDDCAFALALGAGRVLLGGAGGALRVLSRRAGGDWALSPPRATPTGLELTRGMLWSPPTGSFVVEGEDHSEDEERDPDPEVRALVVDCEQNFFWVSGGGRVRRTVAGALGEVAAVRLLSPTRCAVAGGSATALLLDLTTRDSTYLRGHAGLVSAIDASSCSSSSSSSSSSLMFVATGARDAAARVWCASSGRCLAVARGHAEAVLGVALGGSRALLATGSQDRTVKVWDFTAVRDRYLARLASSSSSSSSSSFSWTPEPLEATMSTVAHEKGVRCVALSPNALLLASGSHDRSVCVFSLPSGALRHRLKGHRRGVWDVRFVGARKALLSAGADGALRLWSAESGECLATLEAPAPLLRGISTDFHEEEEEEEEKAMAMEVEGGREVGQREGSKLVALAVALDAEGVVRCWRLSRGGAAAAAFEAHGDRAWGLDALGRHLLTGGDGGDVALWRSCGAALRRAREERRMAEAGEREALRRAVSAGRWAEAAELAVAHEQPRRAYRTFAAMLRAEGGKEGEGREGRGVGDAVAALTTEGQGKLLQMCAEWNTNGRYAEVAQAVLRALLERADVGKLRQAPEFGAALQGIAAYSERHDKRIQELQTQAKIFDFAIAELGDI